MSDDPERAEAPDAPRDEPLSVPCARHPDVETVLRCSHCETPICPRCLVMTPVGARCPKCARLSALPMFQAAPRHYVFALAAGIGSALLGMAALLFIRPFGFLTLLLYAALGYGVGEAVSLATNRKRATPLAAIATGCAGLGALLMGVVTLGPLYGLFAAFIAGLVAWGRVR